MIGQLNDVAEAVLRVMWSPIWQALGLAVVALLIGVVYRGASPSLRYWCWWIVLIRLCIPLSPESPIGLGNSRQFYSVVFESTAVDATTVLAQDISIDPSTNVERRETVTIKTLVVVLWGATVALLLILVAWRSGRLFVEISKFEEVADVDLLVRAKTCAAEVGLSTVPRVLVAHADASITIPCATGMRRPAIVLPQCFLDDACEEELRAVLLHEMVHIRRRDPVWNVVQSVLHCLFFFHPAVWLADRAIRRERELICDDEVIRTVGVDRRSYCRGILRGTSADVGALSILPTLNETKTELGTRLIRIMKNKTPLRTTFAAIAVCVSVFVVAFVILADEPEKGVGGGFLVPRTQLLQPSADETRKAFQNRDTQLELVRRANEGDVAAQRKAGRQVEEVHGTIHVKAYLFAAKRSVIETLDIENLVPTLHQGPFAIGSVQYLLPEGAFETLVEKIKNARGLTLLSTPQVTTSPGRQAEVSVSEAVTIVTKAEVSEPTDPEPKVNFLTQPEIFGPSVRVLPWLYPEGYQIQLTADFHFREFLGYEEPNEKGVVYSSDPKIEPMRYQVPLPLVKNRYVTLSCILNDGQAVLVSGGEQVLGGKDPAIEENSEIMFLAIQVFRETANGERFYDPKYLPFDPDVIPEQSRVQRIVPVD